MLSLDYVALHISRYYPPSLCVIVCLAALAESTHNNNFAGKVSIVLLLSAAKLGISPAVPGSHSKQSIWLVTTQGRFAIKTK
jgi:hypothetical protein